MPNHLILGAGAGLVAAALFASAFTSAALAGILLYLSPLPLCLAGLGWGRSSVLVAGLTGMLIIAVALGPVVSAAFGLAIATPIIVLVHLILLSRPAGQDAIPNGIEWYPMGRVVAWAALMGGLLAAVFVLVLGYDQETYQRSISEILSHSALKELDPDGSVLTPESLEGLSAVLAKALPAAITIVWLTIVLFNLWFAGIIVEASGRALRPWPNLHDLELPNGLVLVFAVALLMSFIPGILGLLATGLAGAMLFAYVLQGLAVIHVYSRNMPLRGVLLAAIYLGILLLGWVAILVAILGLAEPMFGLRARTPGSGRPPHDNKPD